MDKNWIIFQIHWIKIFSLDQLISFQVISLKMTLPTKLINNLFQLSKLKEILLHQLVKTAKVRSTQRIQTMQKKNNALLVPETSYLKLIIQILWRRIKIQILGKLKNNFYHPKITLIPDIYMKTKNRLLILLNRKLLILVTKI